MVKLGEMTIDEVTQKIEKEINGQWLLSNAHGVDLRRCLVNPIKKTYQDIASDDSIELWLILEENPETHSGYKIVMDEETGDFGLAIISDKNEDIFIGFYGTFLETLEAM